MARRGVSAQVLPPAAALRRIALRIDFHAHSRQRSFDSTSSYDEIAEECARAGIDVIVITEHDRLTPAAELPSPADAHGVRMIPGIEVSIGTWGHFLAVGAERVLDEEKHIRIGKAAILECLGRARRRVEGHGAEALSVPEFREVMTEEVASSIPTTATHDPLKFCRAVKAAGGFVSWAHPFVGNRLRKQLDTFAIARGSMSMVEFVAWLGDHDPLAGELLKEVDAVEGFNGMERGISSFLAQDLARALGTPVTAGSDGHTPGSYGSGWLDVETPSEGAPHDAPSLVHLLRTDVPGVTHLRWR